MIHPIILYGDPVLKKAGENIPEGTDVKALVKDMFETMYQANGVGLAAPQIGKSLRLFVIDTRSMEEEEEDGIVKAFINPDILDQEGEEWAFEEGCLSIPGIREDVERKESLTIRYYDENWQLHENVFEDLPARVIQHEYDHIQGILFTDHLSGLKKRLLKSKLGNISKGKVDISYRFKAPVRK